MIARTFSSIFLRTSDILFPPAHRQCQHNCEHLNNRWATSEDSMGVRGPRASAAFFLLDLITASACLTPTPLRRSSLSVGRCGLPQCVEIMPRGLPVLRSISGVDCTARDPVDAAMAR